MKEVSAAIIIRDQKVLMARRAAGESLAGFWEFPGGKREADETISDCLVREIREELALNIEVLGEFGVSDYQYPGGEIRLIGLLAEIKNGEISMTVHDAVEWIELRKVLDYKLAPADIPLAEKLHDDYV
jgi:8-oxo-dGTP diphosphatase